MPTERFSADRPCIPKVVLFAGNTVMYSALTSAVHSDRTVSCSQKRSQDAASTLRHLPCGMLSILEQGLRLPSHPDSFG